MRNIGMYRMQVFDGRTTGMHWQRHKGGAQHYRIAERHGEAPRGGGGPRRRARAVLLGDGPDAGRPGRAAARRVPGTAADRTGEGADGRSRRPGAGEHRAGGLRRAGRAAPRGPLRRPHGLLLAGRRLPGVPPHGHHDAQEARLSHDRRRHSADGGRVPRQGERADLPAAHPEDAAGNRGHALPAGRRLPQPGPHLDRQALPGPRAQDHERVLGARPADVLEVHRRRRQGRERAGRRRGGVGGRHPRRSRARHPVHARPDGRPRERVGPAGVREQDGHRRDAEVAVGRVHAGMAHARRDEPRRPAGGPRKSGPASNGGGAGREERGARS